MALEDIRYRRLGYLALNVPHLRHFMRKRSG